jgi:hypothetical protein
VGITGHRDLRPEDQDALEAQVGRVFEEISEQYPHTPVILLSSLAEGADRLAARVALRCGARLIVPLPLAQDLYEADFQTAESHTEFYELLQQADFSFKLPCVEGNPPESLREPRLYRDQQYAAVGAFIALHSQIFIALWDGVVDDPAETGGTAQIVSFRLNGIPALYRPHRNVLDEDEVGPVCHIVTPRIANPQPEGTPFERCYWLPPNHMAMLTLHGDVKKTFSARAQTQIHQCMDDFNRDTIEQESALTEERRQSESYLFPECHAVLPLVIANLPSVTRASLSHYSMADTLSIHFARLSVKMTQFVFRAMLVAAVCFNLFDSLSGGESAPQTSPTQVSATQASAIQGGAVQDSAVTYGTARQDDASHGTSRRGTLTEQNTIKDTQPPQNVPFSYAAPKDHSLDGHSLAETQQQPRQSVALSQSVVTDGMQRDINETARGMTLAWDFLVWFLQGPWFLTIYLALVGLIVLCHRHMCSRDCQNKHQDYRALAEGLRIQIFWRIAGLNDSVADYYLGEQRSELEWIRNALRTWDFTTQVAEKGISGSFNPMHGLKIGQEYWIRPQKEYFARKAREEYKQVQRNQHLIRLLLRLSFALTALFAILLILLPLENSLGLPLPAWLIALARMFENHWVQGSFMFVSLILAVSAGLLHGYNDQRAYAEHAKQCGRMSVLFDVADRRLQVLLENGNTEEAAVLLRELGKESLAENGNWVLLHRERPLEVPQAG